jgi:hypothetical protein
MKTTIDGKEVTIGTIGARQGWKMLHDLGRIGGESLVEASEDNFASAISALFKNSDHEEFYEMLELIADNIIVDGKKLDLNKYGLVGKCTVAFMKHNFNDFFSPLADALKRLQEPESESE